MQLHNMEAYLSLVWYKKAWVQAMYQVFISSLGRSASKTYTFY